MPKVDLRELILDDECPFCGSTELYDNVNGLLECDECGELIIEEEQPFRKTKKEQVSKKFKSYE
jgi:RNA polymerase subunit RPABC4/transcription elongation factor Spt4